MKALEISGIPQIGLGTFGRTGEEGLSAILFALEIGYRHLDTAQTYDTEAVVGRAVAASGLPRAQVFVTTKVTDANLARKDFMPSLRRSLDTMRLDQVDLTLIHWPSPRDAVPLADYVRGAAASLETQEGAVLLAGNVDFPESPAHRETGG